MQSNVDVVKSAYETAENPLDLDTFASLFSENGYLYDVSGGKKYYGRDMADLVEHFHASFPDIHRELHKIIDHGATVIVELSLKATHTRPLETPEGTLEPSGKKIDVPCCDVFTLKDGKIVSFHCYLAGTILFKQIAAQRPS